MTIASDIVDGALRLITSITPGEPIPGDEASNALTVLNDMIASWSGESFMPPFNTTETFTLVANQKQYTIGTSGSPDFNTARPDEIQDFYFTDTTSNIDYDGELLTQDQYAAIALKSVGTIPHWIWYNPQYPNGQLNVYPVAPNSNFTLTLISLKPVAQFSTLNSTLSMPPQYSHAMKFLLADLLSHEYGFEMPQRLVQEIERCRSIIKAKNAQRVSASFDPLISRRGSFSILTG